MKFIKMGIKVVETFGSDMFNLGNYSIRYTGKYTGESMEPFCDGNN